MMLGGVMLKQSRFVALSVGVGVAVPVLWLLGDWLFLRGNPDLSKWIMGFHFDRVLLAVWPSSVLLMADPEGRSVSIPIMAILTNVALYGGLGWLVSFGLHRYRAALGVAAAIVLVGWYFLFNWYGW